MPPHLPPSLQSEDTIYSADSIEFSGVFPDIFACGTYQIQDVENGTFVVPAAATAAADVTGPEDGSEKGNGDDAAKGKPRGEDDDDDDDEQEADYQTTSNPRTRRLGRTLIYQVISASSPDIDNGEKEDNLGFEQIQSFDGPAVLDMKWSPKGARGAHRLAIANAEGQVTVHKWDENERKLELEQTIQVEDSSVLVLSLDWSNQLDPSNSDSLITSLSSGSLAHLTPTSTGELHVASTWQAHEFEPWITSWDKWDRNIVWSGGDDLKLKKWDMRMPEMPVLVNKNFEGGVTTIASNPHVEHLLAVGSYDENLRLFDSRNARQPIKVIPTGGGIWRTKWNPDPERKGDILLACMHGGFNVVSINSDMEVLRESGQDSEEGWNITSHFGQHTSIAYGADWSLLKTERNENVICSCSFYDHLMHMWTA